jgi:hypothetical protein
MHRPRHKSPSLYAASAIALVTALSAALGLNGAAYGQRINQAISVAVVPFADRTAHPSELIADKATDAVALALEDSQEYVVTPRADTTSEMAATGIARAAGLVRTFPEVQLCRLGERLRVEKVAAGSVDGLSVAKTGECSCTLTVRLLDVATQEYLDGATVGYSTKPIPGWKGESADVINEALRSAAELAVTKMQTSRRPRANVDMVDQAGAIHINLGFRDGVENGMELLVVRGVWNAAQERVVLRKLGVIEVKQVDFNQSRCALKSGAMPRTSDKCYVMYRPTQSLQKASGRAKATRYARIAIGLGALFGAYSIMTGKDAQSAPSAKAFLSQAYPGADPRIQVTAGGGTGSRQVYGWLVYRGSTRGFPAEADNRNYLVSAARGEKLGVFEDDPQRQVGITFEMTFNYLDETGDQQAADVAITYNHTELAAGSSYYYRLRRFVDPGRVRIPVSTGQVADLVDVSFTVDPADALSSESSPAGPVTYFQPPTPELPSDGNSAVNPLANKTRFTWTPSFGADQYKVYLYDNASATGSPVKISPVLTNMSVDAAGSMNWLLNTALDPTTTYYWFVGARRSSDAAEPVIQSLGTSGWIFSSAFSFTTSPTPPNPASAMAVTTTGHKPTSTRAGSKPGWWPDVRGR